MKYVYLNSSVAHQILDENDPSFPGVPIEQRYSQEFLNQCVTVDDLDIPPIGHIFNGVGFEAPPIPEPVKPPIIIEEVIT